MNNDLAIHAFRKKFRRAGLLTVGFLALTAPALMMAPSKAASLSPEASEMLGQYPQARNMSGYVLNGETNMNRIYSRKLDPGLSPDSERDNGPVIIFEKARTPEGKEQPFLLNVERQWPPIQPK